MFWVSLLIWILLPLTSFGPLISRTAFGLASRQGFTKVEEGCGGGVNGSQCESALLQTLGNMGAFIGEGSERDHTIRMEVHTDCMPFILTVGDS
jgi:hypothetical protein